MRSNDLRDFRPHRSYSSIEKSLGFFLVLAAPSQISSRRRREEAPPSYLKWVTFEGKLPPDAVSNWNSYTQQLEYVCSTQDFICNTGAYVPQRGPVCSFPYGGWQRLTRNFKILVNVGNLEALDWVAGSFGSVPETAVEGCPATDIFVGRNRYGLGKVVKEQRSFFVVDDLEEVWYKWYEVLVVRKGPADVNISHVSYNLSEAVEHGEDLILTKATERNEGCWGSRRTFVLEEDTELEQDWEMDQRVFSTVRGVLTAAPLVYGGAGWEVTNVTEIPWVGGASTSEFVIHRHQMEEELQPRTVCSVALEGRRVDLRTPFKAQLTRDFGDGRHHHVAVTGWTRSRTVVDVHVGTKECWPITDLPPCQE